MHMPPFHTMALITAISAFGSTIYTAWEVRMERKSHKESK